MKKWVIIIIVMLKFESMYMQNNIIPNGDFEYNKQAINCNSHAGCIENMDYFNSLIYHWEAAIHNNDASNKNDIGNIYYLDINVNQCQNLIFSDNSFCSSLIPSPQYYSSFNNLYPNILGTKFVRLRADIDKIGSKVKYKHGAIGVALVNGKKFDKDKNYIIRYKIAPIRSRNCSNKSGDIKTNSQFDNHVRFFLSELGPQHWDKNISDKQELINVNYFKSTYNSKNCSSSICYVPCNFSQEERVFQPNQNNYTTLVIYMERGGIFIDDIEVFEACESPYYIQKKVYSYELYYPGAVNGGNMKEASGGSLYAGYSVTNTKSNGDVILAPGSKVIFTAEEEIGLLEGFEVYENAEFIAEIQSCPNTLNGRISSSANSTINENVAINESDIFNDLNNELLLSYFKSEIQLLPNPAQDQFYILLNDEDWYDLQKIELSTPLGQTTPLPKDHVQTIAHLPNGLCFLKFYFSNGIIVVKPLVVQK